MSNFCRKNRYPLLFLSLAILLAGSYLIWPTLAKYRHQEDLADKARTAIFVGEPLTNLKLQDDSFSPGETEELTFSITNVKGDRKTEVAVSYQMTLEEFGTLPIQSELFRVKGDHEEPVKRGSAVKLPAGSEQLEVHDYKIKLSWPEHENHEYYQNDMKIQRLKIQTEQID